MNTSPTTSPSETEVLLSRGEVKILFGSQTGCAQDIAERLARILWRHHFKVTLVSALDDYDKTELIEEKLVIFLCSTMGEGEEPDNMKNFWKFLLRRNLPNDILNSLQYTVFGLGDSSYNKFNFPAKKLFRRLQQLGANPICERGDGDDMHQLGVEGGLKLWLNDLIIGLNKLYPTTSIINYQPIPDHICPAANYKLVKVDIPNIIVSSEDFIPKDSIPFKLTSCNRITSINHFQDVRHLILEAESNICFNPGDIASFYPKNSNEDVVKFIELMGWQNEADSYYELVTLTKGRPKPNYFNQPRKLTQIIKNYIDLNCTPKRTLIDYLIYFTKDITEKDKFIEWTDGTVDGMEDMLNYLNKPKRTTLELLSDFHSIKVPLDYLIDMFSNIQQRSFSIAGGNNNSLEVLVGIVNYKTIMKLPRLGLATKYLKYIDTLSEPQTLHLSITSGTMKLPIENSIPIIMIGPGLGLAPFRSFIQTRIKQNCKNNYLIFGCRSKESDEYFNKEWLNYSNQGNLWYRVAYSRDQESKRYVQQIILENGSLLWDLIHNQNANIYICGSSGNMPKGVMEAFHDIMKLNYQSLSTTDEIVSPQVYFDNLIKIGRYQLETWS